MRSLDVARDACERHHPGLVKSLADIPLTERETPGSPVIDLFRTHGGTGLLAPAAYGGHGVDALEAVRVTRAVGASSPSLGVAATMHNFTTAMLFALAADADRLTPSQIRELARIAPEGLLLASGWAEGRTEQNILSPSVVCAPVDGGFLVNGAKKPCSLSGSMSLLTASVSVPGENGAPTLAVLLIPADSPGITIHPFWSSPVLAAAQSEEVRLADVFVPDSLLIRTTADDPKRLDDLQAAAFVWFEMLVTSAYVGAASTLVELVLARGRGSVSDRAALGLHLENAVALTEGVARAVRDGLDGDEAVSAVLVARFAAQTAIGLATDLAVELLGGIAFITAPEIAYLCSAVRPLGFHPPSRTSTADALVEYWAGGPLVLA
ncbi:acyl-CoA dehydrogenase family protein [Parafrankia sp. FMc2]|uniref:acyl-CoA dehydrogenase family protein n=1 Tax=Parafrankia sp. FMc2 TaxID=3233196 RepID=UPI0034D44BF6